MATSIKGLAYPLLLLLGLLLTFIVYKIDEDNRKQINIQKYAPLIKLPVVYRLKRWGTLKYPNKIYVRYRRKDYSLTCSNQYFKNTLDSSIISVHYDLSSDRAVLAYSPIARAYGPLIAVALIGLLTAVKAVMEIHQQLVKNRVT